MTKQLHLHVGEGRAGSSAIQVFLKRNREFLASHDIIYPHLAPVASLPISKTGNGTNFAFSLQKPELASAQIAAVLERIIRLPQRSAIISSEALDRTPHEPLALLCCKFSCALDLRVYIYIRDPFDRIVSRYAQSVKSRGLTVDVNEYIRTIDVKSRRLWDRLQKFSAIFGDRFSVAIYQRDRLVNHDIRLDFLSRVGVPIDGLEIPDDVNASANAFQIEAMRALNKMIDRGKWSPTHNREFLKVTSKVEGPPISQFVDPDLERDVRRQFEAEIEQVKAAYFPGLTGPLFEPRPIVARRKISEVRDGRMFEALVHCLVSERVSIAAERHRQNQMRIDSATS